MLVHLDSFLDKFALENVRIFVSTATCRMDCGSYQVILLDEIDQGLDLTWIETFEIDVVTIGKFYWEANTVRN